MAIALEAQKIHKGEFGKEAAAEFSLKVIEAVRHRCTIVFRNLQGLLSVVEGQDVTPIKMQGATNARGDAWVTFETEKPGEYKVKFEANKSGTYQAYGVVANMEGPPRLLGKLIHPLKTKETGKKKTQITDTMYGPYASVWGNEQQDPQFDGPDDDPEFYRREGFFHLGHDIEAEEGDEVVAVADGTVVRVGDSGGNWGHYVVVEHEVDGYRFTTTYEHLQNEGRPTVDHRVGAGDQIGTIIKMTEPGEKTHLHLSMHEGAHRPFIPKADRPEGYIWSNRGATPLALGFKDFFNAGDDMLYQKD